MTAPKQFTKTTAEIMQLVNEYYELPGNIAGGNLHIVLDDGNVEDNHIEWCREVCRVTDDAAGIIICDLLLERGRSTRRRIAR